MPPSRPRCFNPRAPCGARLICIPSDALFYWFQSTRPMRGATLWWLIVRNALHVSIHAPHAGRDLKFKQYRPYGTFQSTRPMRGATGAEHLRGHRHGVSIHAPHAGRDLIILRRDNVVVVSIHAPHAGRDLHLRYNANFPIKVSIHAPHAGRDPRACCAGSRCRGFNPRAPCGARHRALQGAIRRT